MWFCLVRWFSETFFQNNFHEKWLLFRLSISNRHTGHFLPRGNLSTNLSSNQCLNPSKPNLYQTKNYLGATKKLNPSVTWRLIYTYPQRPHASLHNYQVLLNTGGFFNRVQTFALSWIRRGHALVLVFRRPMNTSAPFTSTLLSYRSVRNDSGLKCIIWPLKQTNNNEGESFFVNEAPNPRVPVINHPEYKSFSQYTKTPGIIPPPVPSPPRSLSRLTCMREIFRLLHFVTF